MLTFLGHNTPPHPHSSEQEQFATFSANMAACQDKLLVRSSAVDEYVKVGHIAHTSDPSSLPSVSAASYELLSRCTPRSNSSPPPLSFPRMYSCAWPLLPRTRCIYIEALSPLCCSRPLMHPTPCAPVRAAGGHGKGGGLRRLVELASAGRHRGPGHHMLVRAPFPSHLPFGLVSESDRAAGLRRGLLAVCESIGMPAMLLLLG